VRCAEVGGVEWKLLAEYCDTRRVGMKTAEDLHSDGACWRLSRRSNSATKVMMSSCAEYDRLHGDVESVLGNLAQVITLLLEMFRSKELGAVHRLDKQLELSVGEKERCIGALRQHVREHKCAGPL
jgi:hypothetical protein